MNNFKTFIETHEPAGIVSVKSDKLGQAILDANNMMHKMLMADTSNLLVVSKNSKKVLEHLGQVKKWTSPAYVDEALYVGNLVIPEVVFADNVQDTLPTVMLPQNTKVFYVHETEHMHDNYVFVIALSKGLKYNMVAGKQLPTVYVEMDDDYPPGALKTYISINIEQ